MSGRLLPRPRLRLAGRLCLALGTAAFCRDAAAAAGPGGAFTTVVRADSDPHAADPVPGQWTVQTPEAQNVASSLGDALRVVDAAPAVARPPLGSGALSLWGAAPADTRILYMGMELPALYHFGGQRGVLQSALLRDFTLIPAAFGSEFGRALGGLVLLAPAAVPEGFHGAVAADLLDASAVLTAALGTRLKVAAAGRYSYLDRVLTLLSRPDLGDFFPLPQYYDAQAQASLRCSPRAELRATFLASGDSMIRSHAAGDAGQAQSETWQRSFYRLGVQYEQRSESGAQLQLSPWLGLDRQQYAAAFGLTPAQQSQDDLLYGLRASYSLLRAARRLTVALRLGFDLLGEKSDLERGGTLTRPPREGDLAVFGQRPGSEVNADSFAVHTLDAALFATLSLRLRWLRIEPGLRIGATLLDASRLLPPIGAAPPLGARRIDFVLDPRLALHVKPLAPLTLTLAGGLYHQPPAPADRSAVFGNPTLGLQRAAHGSFSAEILLRAIWRIEAAAYVRFLDQLVARSPLPTPPLARVLTQDGSGLSYGGQVQLRFGPLGFRRGTLSAWVSYALSRSERRDAPAAPPRLFALDQTHALQAALQARVFGLGIAVRLRYSTGLPRTPVTGSYYNALADQYEPIFGPIYSSRLPDFVQVDARLDYTFRLGARVRLGVQLEVQNLTHHDNAEEIAYSPDFQRADYITGLPTLAVAGARLEF